MDNKYRIDIKKIKETVVGETNKNGSNDEKDNEGKKQTELIQESIVKKVKKEVKEEVKQELGDELRKEIKQIKPENKEKGGIFIKITKLSLYLLVFLAPIFFLPLTIFPVSINKLYLSLGLLLVAFFFYLLYSIENQKIIYPKSLLSLSVLSFFVIAIISVIFSQSLEISLFGNLIQPDSLLSFLAYGLVFFLSSIIFKKEDFKRVFITFVLGFLLALFYGLLQIFGKFIIPWRFTHLNGFNSVGNGVLAWAVFAGFGLVMIISILNILSLKKTAKIVLSLIGLLIVVALIIVNLPIIWIGLLLAMVLLIFVDFARKENIIFPLVIFTISLFFLFSANYLPRFVDLAPEYRPNLGTTIIVDKAVLSNPKNLIIGSGPSTFTYDFVKYRPLKLNLSPLWPIRFNHGFSFFVTMFSTLGLLGVLAFLLVVLSFLFRAFRKRDNKENLIIGSGLFYLISTLFLSYACFNNLLFLFLGLGLLNVGSKMEDNMEIYSGSKIKNLFSFLYLFVLIFLLSFTFFAVYFLSQKYLAAIYYQKGSTKSSLLLLTKAVRFDSQSDLYWRALSQMETMKANQIVNEIVSSRKKDNSIRTKLQDYTGLAIKHAKKSIEINSVNSLNWSNLGHIYKMLVDLGEQKSSIFAKSAYKKAIELDPQNPQNRVNLAALWFSLANNDKAMRNKDKSDKEIKKAESICGDAIRLKPDYLPAHLLMSQIYAQQGNKKSAIAELEQVKMKNLGNSTLAFQLGSLYYNDNDIDKAQIEFERAVSIDPNYSNARYLLGMIYDKKGMKKQAIEQFKVVEKLNPGNAAVKKILANLEAGKPALSKSSEGVSNKIGNKSKLKTNYKKSSR